MVLRQKANIETDRRLDPFDLQDKFGIVIADPTGIPFLDQADREQLSRMDARTWSGGAQELPDGRLLILLNPNQTRERAVVTVMEEVAHAHFGHTPSILTTDASTLFGRRYDPVAEDEAYWTAAAALLPSRVIAHAVWHGSPAAAIAALYGVSVELVEFRVKTLRLWPFYRDYQVAA
jgi:hypothetical protein